MKKINLYIGMNERIITEKEIRNAQAALMHDQLSENDRAIIDAVISHFVCGRDTKWTF